MLRISQVKTRDTDRRSIEHALMKKLGLKNGDLKHWKIYRRSVDARHHDVTFSWIIDADIRGENRYLTRKDVRQTPQAPAPFVPKGVIPLTVPPVVAGFGPAGMFAALDLAEHGYRPIVLERGRKIEDRRKDADHFWKTGELDPESNVQFGEGGAGAFSDGKLTTRSRDPLVDEMLEKLHAHGADADILVDAYPHIGTDAFESIIRSIRNRILELGGQIRFESRLEQVKIEDDRLQAIEVNGQWEPCQALILALGHSASDTLRWLHDNGVAMESKPFQVGVRIEHPQTFINEAMLHDFSQDPRLIPARYTLTAMSDNGKGIYTFCMCPGGYVIASSAQPGQLVVNGMSYADRAGKNANSALLVQVNEEDYGPALFAGLEYQEAIERKAFELSRDYRAPVQKAADYLTGTVSNTLSTAPTYEPGTIMADLNGLFSDKVNHALHQGLEDFERKVPGFLEGTMTGVETRASSALRIPRDRDTRMADDGIYPAGEGSGYTGGIMTSAIDGIKSARALMDRYAPAAQIQAGSGPFLTDSDN